MRKNRTRCLLAIAAVGMLTLAIAGPASAVGTTAKVTVTGGALPITAPADAGNIGTIANTVLGGTISGPLGQVQVNDACSAAWFWLGRDRHLDRLHPTLGTDDRRGLSRLHRRTDHEGRQGNLHGE